jgi:hypothetical protein
MNFKFLKASLAVMTIFVSSITHAGIIFGDLNYESGDSYVTDSLNNREWARFDVMRGTVAEWTNEFNDLNSSLYGFTLAKSFDTELFTDAAFGIGNYDVLSRQWPVKTGINAYLFMQVMGDGFDFNNNNIWKYYIENDLGVSTNVTHMYLRGQTSRSTNLMHEGSIRSQDTWSSNMTFLAFRTIQDVPEPSTLAIFALGMIGLASRRYKKQS